MLDRQHLFLLLDYDPETGVFRWRTQRRNIVAGTVAGSLDGKGYLRLTIDYTEYRAHRLAWFYMTGVWPDVEVDHKNRCRTDNRWCNLRLATSGEQKQNAATRCDSSTRVRGVGFLASKQKWLVRIAVGGTRRYVGLFDTLIDAVAARIRAERDHFTHLFEPT